MNKAKRILTLVTYVIDILATIIIVVFILNFNRNFKSESEVKTENYDHLYMVEGTVTGIDNNVISVTTVNNDVFRFYTSNGTWAENDGCILLLDNNNTPNNVTDDKIINSLYDMR